MGATAPVGMYATRVWVFVSLHEEMKAGVTSTISLKSDAKCDHGKGSFVSNTVSYYHYFVSDGPGVGVQERCLRILTPSVYIDCFQMIYFDVVVFFVAALYVPQVSRRSPGSCSNAQRVQWRKFNKICECSITKNEGKCLISLIYCYYYAYCCYT